MSTSRIQGCIGVLVLLFVSVLTGQDRAPELSSIEGTVVKYETSDGLQGVTVTATPETGPAKKTTTDADGNFAIHDLSDGRYTFTLARTGFVKPKHGAGPTNLTLARGQKLTGIQLPMAGTSVITGKVVDDSGNPKSGASVYAVAPRYENGWRTLYPSSSSESVSAKTDASGSYRLYGVEPGEYFVTATTADRWLAVFYPNVTDPADAIPVELYPGMEIGGIDIRLTDPSLHTIRMKLNMPANRVGITFSNSPPIQIIRHSRNDMIVNYGLVYGPGLQQSNDGAFVSPGLPRGSYEMFVSEGILGTASAHATFEITDHDLDIGTITLERLAPITGRIQLLAGTNFDSMRIVLTPIDGRDRLMASAVNTTARIGADGTFRFAANSTPANAESSGSIGDGIYQVGVSGIPSSVYIASALYAGHNVLETGLHVDGNPQGTLELTLETGGTIRGVVKNGDKNVAESLVAVIPAPIHRGNLSLFKTASTDQNGNFTIRGVAPGEYGIVAWEDVEPNAWLNPDFLKPFETRAMPLRVIGSSSVDVTVRVIPASN